MAADRGYVDSGRDNGSSCDGKGDPDRDIALFLSHPADRPYDIGVLPEGRAPSVEDPNSSGPRRSIS